jgi:prepilin-type N-terminal cleavage/methylation domain-containing protein
VNSKQVLKTEKRKKRMRKQKGFSLIELLIVVAIILIIAAIAIPNLLRAKISANESSAVGSVRNVITAEASYQSSYPQYGFATTLRLLGPNGGAGCPAGPNPTVGACLLDSALGGAAIATKSGYIFEAAAANAAPADPLTGIAAWTDFTASASPVTYNQTGVRVFCAGSDGVLRQNPNTGGGFTGAQNFTPWAATCTPNPWVILQ